MKFLHEDLDELVYGFDSTLIKCDEETLKVSDDVIYYRMVFKYNKKYYWVDYKESLIEDDDLSTFDVDENGCVECEEVEPHEVLVIKFRPVKE